MNEIVAPSSARPDPGSMTPVKILNVTPLLLTANAQLLKPFQAVDCPWDPARGIAVLHPASGCPIKNVPASACQSLSTLTIDTAFVRDKLGSDVDGVPEADSFAVTNQTEFFVDAYRISGEREDWEQRIEPGESARFSTRSWQLWQFRSTFANEIIGMVVSPRPGRISATLTDEFRQDWLKYQKQSAEASSTARFAPLRVIGEQRGSTPAPEAQSFITATTVRREFQKAVFNGVKNQVLRDVEISGVLLRWSGSSAILREYYGEHVTDIRSLTIYADRMEVGDHLHFPRTDVTIYARELAFTGIGCIDTTPRPSALRAASEYLTKDPLDPTNAGAPADSEGKPTYEAKGTVRRERRGGTSRCMCGG